MVLSKKTVTKNFLSNESYPLLPNSSMHNNSKKINKTTPKTGNYPIAENYPKLSSGGSNGYITPQRQVTPQNTKTYKAPTKQPNSIQTVAKKITTTIKKVIPAPIVKKVSQVFSTVKQIFKPKPQPTKTKRGKK